MARALPRVSGPVHIYVSFIPPNLSGLTTISDYMYLGTCEVTPEYTERFYYKKLQNEAAGETLPIDETWEGYDFLISLLLTSYDQDTYAAIVGNINGPSAIPGSFGFSGVENLDERGKTIYGAKTCQLILQNSFYGTTLVGVGNTRTDDIPGYLFYFAKLATATPVQGGTKANKLGMIFECVSGLLFPSSTGPFLDGKFVCYGIIPEIARLIPTT